MLFQINPKVLQAQLKANKAALLLTQFEFIRFKKLYRQNVVSLDKLTRVRSLRDIDKANIEKTKQQLDLATIRAPFDGRLGLKQVDVGDFVKAGDIISTLQSLDQFRVDFSIPEKYSLHVKMGLKVQLQGSANPGKTYVGTVYAFNPIINKNTRMLDVRAHVHTKELLPGMYVDVTLTFGKEQSVVIVPQTAVTASLHGDYVY